MAKSEWRLTGNFDQILDRLHDGIMGRSLSASFEDGSDFADKEVRCAVRVYERYSAMGGNRVSLNLTLIGRGEKLFLSAITSGGVRPCFLSSTPWGRKRFLIRSGNWWKTCEAGGQ